MTVQQALAWFGPIVAALLTCAGQLWLNQKFKRADAKRDEARRDTDAKRAAEAEWREHVVTRLDQQDERIDTILAAQCSQMRSDIVHKCHRYLDDLGKASTEEKDALKAEHDEYSAVCAANEITNNFVDMMVQRVMELPEREV